MSNAIFENVGKTLLFETVLGEPQLFTFLLSFYPGPSPGETSSGGTSPLSPPRRGNVPYQPTLNDSAPLASSWRG